MKALYPEEWPQFFTATIVGWKHLLKEDRYKDIIIKSLQYLAVEKKIFLNGFVIMSNHVHFIWQAMPGYSLKKLQVSFTNHTSKEFLKVLKAENRLKEYEVNSADRKHAFWKRNPLGIELFTPTVFAQKLNYIHENPVRAALCVNAEDYRYSSASFYESGEDRFGLLKHWMG